MTRTDAMPWIDISAPVAPGRVPAWPGSPPVRFDKRLSLDAGDNADDTTVTMSLHCGTHIDAPGHFLRGAATADALPLDVFIGPCFVADCRGVLAIDDATLEAAGIPEHTTRLLLRTDNDTKWGPSFDDSFVAVTQSGARWLAERGLSLVGIDYLSIQPYRESDEVHRIILGAGVTVLEGLMLGEVAPGPYVLMCLPMKFVGTEGAPARALLLPLDQTDRAFGA